MKKNIPSNKSGYIFVAVVVAIFCLANLPVGFDIYYKLASGTEVVETGSAYGVTIGQTKQEAMHDMMTYHAETKVYLGLCKYRSEWKCAKLSQMDGYDDFIEEDIWHFSLIYGCCDFVDLYFKNGKLVKIRRDWSPGSIP